MAFTSKLKHVHIEKKKKKKTEQPNKQYEIYQKEIKHEK